jgi:hypothetical protein
MNRIAVPFFDPEQVVDKGRYLDCDSHLHPVTLFPPIFSSPGC